MPIKNRINRKLYFILLAASGLSVVAIMPYIVTLQGDLLKAAPVPLPVVILASVLQSLILFAVLIVIGLKLAKQLGFQTPFLENTNKKQKILPIIKLSVGLGCLAGIMIVLLDLLFTKAGISITLLQKSVPIWQGFLASFYGWISEEIVMRLFFMTTVLWFIGKLYKGKVIENKAIMWIGIIIASIIFGLWHLPVTSSLTTISPLVIIRALLLNGIWGLLFGRLYWKKGLESAIIAHFSADIIIQVALPLLILIIS